MSAKGSFQYRQTNDCLSVTDENQFVKKLRIIMGCFLARVFRHGFFFSRFGPYKHAKTLGLARLVAFIIRQGFFAANDPD